LFKIRHSDIFLSICSSHIRD